jgi:hypothetical protein
MPDECLSFAIRSYFHIPIHYSGLLLSLGAIDVVLKQVITRVRSEEWSLIDVFTEFSWKVDKKEP